MKVAENYPTTNELLMIEYQEAVLRRVAERSGLPLAEIGVMAATFLEGLARHELADVRGAAGRHFKSWVAAELPVAWAS